VTYLSVTLMSQKRVKCYYQTFQVEKNVLKDSVPTAQ